MGEKGLNSSAAVTILALILSTAFILSTLQIRTDDSYIFLVYARNVVLGSGLVFNPGEYINGSTSALFPLLIALIAWPLQALTDEPFLLASRLLQIGSLTLICIFAWRIFVTIGVPFAAAVFPFLFLGNDLAALGIGMESFLALALLMMTLDFYVRGHLQASAIAAGFMVLARPDSVLLFVPLGAHYLWKHRCLPPPATIACFLAVVTPWVLFSWYYYGGVLPETLAAKTAQTESGRWGHGLLFLKGFSKVWQSYASLAGIIVFLSLVIIWLRRKGLELLGFSLLILWIALYFLTYAFLLNPPPYPWYYTPFVLPLAFAASLALSALIARLSEGRTRLMFESLVLSSCVVLFMISLSNTSSKPVTAKYEIYKQAALWLNQNVPEGSSLACNEVGVLGYYYTRGRIIDPLGLITKGAAEHVRNKRYAWYLAEHSPDYLVLNHPPRALLEDFHKRDWFKDKYEIAQIIRTERSAVRIYRRRVNV